MANDQLCWMSAADLAAAIRKRQVSPVDAIDAVLDRIGMEEP
jgi:Asp-tRNA(Asn)/Glu-tRNA(Gln) amidotransferase A subunit family amidase